MVDFKKVAEKINARGKTMRVLDNLKDGVESCRSCPLSLTRKRTAFSAGNPLAKVVILGEGPSEDEDAKGELMVGRVGHLLERMLETIGLTLQDVYVMNTVKCRSCEPDANRGGRLKNCTPTEENLQACRDWTDQQLRALPNARLVICFGSTPAHWLLGYDLGTFIMAGMRRKIFGIGRYRKDPTNYEDPGLAGIITYHPAYLLRNPQEKPKVYADLLQVKAVLDGTSDDMTWCDATEAQNRDKGHSRIKDTRPWGVLLPTQTDPYSEELTFA